MAQLTAVTEGDYSPKEKFAATADIAGGMLPYLGRYRESLQMAEAGLDTLKALGLTDRVLEVTLNVGGLHFWAWQDTARLWELVESTYDYPDSLKSETYWMNLSALNLILGRTDEGMRIFQAHNKREVLTPLYRALGMASVGECAAAEALLDSVPALRKAEIASVYFRTAVCYFDNADYESTRRLLALVVAPENHALQNAIFLSISHYYMAKCFEALGKPTEALREYQSFLDIWKNADEDQPKLVDARERAAALESAGSM